MANISTNKAFSMDDGAGKKKTNTGTDRQTAPLTQPAAQPKPAVQTPSVTIEPAKPLYPGTPGPGEAGRAQSAESRLLTEDYDRARTELQDARDRLGAAGQPRAQTEAERNTLADYERAMAALRQTEKAAPGYDGGLDAQIGDLYAKITGRGDFQYDLNEDALWQQLKDDYTRAGKTAMRDTMGQAAMLTGGYGSSYSQAAGQAAYDEYLTQLSERAPELYDRAYARYKDEGDEMRKNLDFLLERDRTGYDRYRDAYGDWLKERDYLGGQAEDAYNKAMQERGYADERADLAYTRALQELGLAGDNEREAYDRRVQERAYTDERADADYKKQGDRRELLLSLLSLGYTPNAQEIRDAGLSQAQVDALREAYAPKKTGGSYAPQKSAVEDEAASGKNFSITEESRQARLNKSGSGGGIPAQKMGSIYSAISNADTPEKALEQFDAIPDRTLKDMTKNQKKQLTRALEIAGITL